MPHHNEGSKETNGRGSVTYISTRYYRGPELLYNNPHYGREIDIWAAGCVLAEMFTLPQLRNRKYAKYNSYTLFRGESNVHQLALVIQTKGTPTQEETLRINPDYAQPPLPQKEAQGIASRLDEETPKEVVDLISRLLEYEPLKRITAE